MTANEDRWRRAVERVVSLEAAVIAEVDAVYPRTRYPWHRRLWWRLAGTPTAVKERQWRESKQRAELFAATLHRRRGEAQ